MLVAGIDFSLTNCGVSIYDSKKDVTSTYSIKTKPGDFENEWLRYKHIADEVHSLLKSNKIKYALLEDYFINPMNPTSTLQLIEGGSILRNMLTINKYSWTTATASQLKKFVTGSGVGNKSLIIKEVFKKYNIDVDDDNQADAVVLSRIMASVLSESTNTKYEKEVVEKLKVRKKYNW